MKLLLDNSLAGNSQFTEPFEMTLNSNLLFTSDVSTTGFTTSMMSNPNYYIKKQDKDKEKEVSKELHNSGETPFEYKDLITAPLYEGIHKINTKSVKPLLKTDDQKLVDIGNDSEKDCLKSPISVFIPLQNKKKLPNSFETYKKMMVVKKKVQYLLILIKLKDIY